MLYSIQNYCLRPTKHQGLTFKSNFLIFSILLKDPVRYGNQTTRTYTKCLSNCVTLAGEVDDIFISPIHHTLKRKKSHFSRNHNIYLFIPFKISVTPTRNPHNLQKTRKMKINKCSLVCYEPLIVQTEKLQPNKKHAFSRNVKVICDAVNFQ